MLQTKPKDFFRDKCHPYFKSIESNSMDILEKPIKGRIFNPFQFVNQKFKQNKHPGAVNEVLEQMVKYWDNINNPWSYANAVLKTVNGNWCERDHIDRHESVKKEFDRFVANSEDLRFLLRDIGN